MDNKVIIIVGPTAIGKTYVSIELAKRFETEIISADSMQIYKYMNIGTAKVTKEEKQNIKHHMIDIIEPNEAHSVSEFKNLVEKIIDDILDKNRNPIIVGGSGLYINSIMYDLDFGNAKSDEKIRNLYTQYYEDHGEDALYDKLLEIDPKACEKIHKNNIKRVIRALEVNHITGEKFSEINTDIRKQNDKKYNTIVIGLKMDRKILYQRINERVDQMFEDGLIEEVKWLTEKGYHKNLVSMQGIGYKEIIAYFRGLVTLEECKNILKRNTRRFAKRQFTWFSKDEEIKWFDIESISDIDNTIEKIYDYVKCVI